MEWSLVHSCTTNAVVCIQPRQQQPGCQCWCCFFDLFVFPQHSGNDVYTIARGVVLAPSLLSSALEQFTTERSNAWCTLFILSATLHCSALLCYYCCLCRAARLYRRTLYTRLETFSLMSISQSDSPNSHRMTNGATNKFKSTVKERKRGSRQIIHHHQFVINA